VAVVIPCYNHGRFVADAVRSALTQPGVNVRVVIVNDGSTDGTTAAQCDACRELSIEVGGRSVPDVSNRVVVVHQTNAGLPSARNRGANDDSVASCPLIAFLDADDYFEARGLADLVEALEAAERAGRAADISHVYGQQRMTELGHGVWAVPDWDPLLLMITNLHPPMALVKRTCFEAVGGFDPSMRHGYEDWDFWLKFAERRWRGLRVRTPVYAWRRHSHETMIHAAIARHDELYARIVENHRPFFESNALDIIRRANQMLRRENANWLDENLEAIPLRDMRAWVKDLIVERDAARAERDAERSHIIAMSAQAELAASEARGALESLRTEYESKPSVKMSRRLHALIDRCPRPISSAIRRLMLAAKSTLRAGGNPAQRP
jgi:glycosyltransferase involved in cell wall biosynthesis